MEQKNVFCDKNFKSFSKRTKIRRRYLCKILKKKRTKVGCCFSCEPEDFLVNKISMKSKIMKPGIDSLFNQKRYLAEHILNMKEMINKEVTFPTDKMIDPVKLKPCDSTKFSRSSNFIHSSSRLHKVQMQILKLYKRKQEIFDRTRSDTNFSRLIRTKSFGGEAISRSMLDLCCSNSRSEEEKGDDVSHASFNCSRDPPTQKFSLSNIPPPQHSNLRLCAQVRSAHNLISSTVRNTHVSNVASRTKPFSFSPYRFKTIFPIDILRKDVDDKENISPHEGKTCRSDVILPVTRNRAYTIANPPSRYHPISTIKARERNFLRGRVAVTSLLGSSELERSLPHRELRIFVGTWNMNSQVPDELNDFLLPPILENVSDVIVVGTQESYSERLEWEVRVQETLGPSHLLYHSTMLGSLHLVVFIRRDLIWFCSLPEDATYSIRPAATFRTKGAVAIGFVVFGSSYLFITSHLSAHTSKIKERIYEVKKITRSLDLPRKLPARHKSQDVTQNYDYVFWCGDLNFRLSESREEIMHWVTKQNFPLNRPFSMHSDQLKRKISEGVVFRDFQEGPITFPPTYKYNLGTQVFDTSHKLRSPAYTDRILYKCRGRCALKCLLYSSVQSMCTSDHKPVWGLFTSVVRPGIDNIPLAAGLFNRDVYLEAIKRRATAMDRNEGSAVCSIQ